MRLNFIAFLISLIQRLKFNKCYFCVTMAFNCSILCITCCNCKEKDVFFVWYVFKMHGHKCNSALKRKHLTSLKGIAIFEYFLQLGLYLLTFLWPGLTKKNSIAIVFYSKSLNASRFSHALMIFSNNLVLFSNFTKNFRGYCDNGLNQQNKSKKMFAFGMSFLSNMW